MRRHLATAALLFAAIVIGAPAASAHDRDPQFRTIEAVLHQVPKYEVQYLAAHDKAVGKLGAEAVGRNIVAFGWNGKSGVRHATRNEVENATQRLVAAVAPPPEPVYPAIGVYQEPAEPVGTTGGSYNSTVMCESGGDYSIDTGNGYYGGYQFDSGTWDAYGDPAYAEASDAPPAVQDAAAAAVPYDAWPNC